MTSSTNVTIVIPVYNDWEALRLLIGRIDQVFSANAVTANIVAIDDGSSRAPSLPMFQQLDLKAVRLVRILRLKRNLGHQRAIVTGLVHLHRSEIADDVLVMDADGEDRPEDALRLIQKSDESQGQAIVFAERTWRSEDLLFRIFYRLYRTTFELFSGSRIRFGNFSLVPRALVGRLVTVSEIWNHYSAGILKSRVPMITIPTIRGFRLTGKSTMNFLTLVLHGLGAISVFSDVIGARALLITSGLALGLFLGLIAWLLGAGTSLVAPVWGGGVLLLAGIVFSQALMFSMLFAFMVLSARNYLTFVPSENCGVFIEEEWQIYPPASPAESKQPHVPREALPFVHSPEG